jgi:hypothetical protein
MEQRPKHFRAPELYGDFWFNSEPISIRAHEGSVILIDFWDFTSIHSLRTLPYVKDWFRKYEEFGVKVIGVHTPEFKFGRNPENVQKAIKRFAISYPVVTDNDGLMWNAYGVRGWPTKCLVDRDGFIRYEHQGEGSYEQFERALQSLLAEAGVRSGLPDLTIPVRETDEPGAVSFRATTDVYLGYIRGTIGNVEGYGAESTVDYIDRGFHLPGRFYAKGKWIIERECIRYAGDAGEEGHLSIIYQGIEANIVLDIEGGKSAELVIEQDGLPLSAENKGDDIRLEGTQSRLLVDTPRLYQLVKNKEFGEHSLKIIASQSAFSAYSFSFVTSVIPDLVPRS